MTPIYHGDPSPLLVRTRDRRRYGLIPAGTEHVLWNDGTSTPLDDVVDELEEITEPCAIEGCVRLGGFHGLCSAHWLETPFQIRKPFWDGNHDEGLARARAYYGKDDPMKLVLSKPEGQCHAMRCTEAATMTIDGAPWGRAQATVCGRHYGQAIAAFGVDAIKVLGMDAESSIVEAPRTVGVDKGGPDLTAITIVPPDLASEETDARDLVDVARTFTVEGREDLETAAAVLADVKGKLKRIAERKEEITRPMNEALKSARALFRPLENYFGEAETLLKKAIGDWHLREAEANRAAMKAAAEAHAAGDTAARADALAKVGTIRGTDGISAYTKWDYVIEDERALPREFLMPNEKLIREACNHSTDREPTPIPGVRFFPKPVVSSRAT